MASFSYRGCIHCVSYQAYVYCFSCRACIYCTGAKHVFVGWERGCFATFDIRGRRYGRKVFLFGSTTQLGTESVLHNDFPPDPVEGVPTEHRPGGGTSPSSSCPPIARWTLYSSHASITLIELSAGCPI